MEQPFGNRSRNTDPGVYTITPVGNTILITARGRWDRTLVRAFAGEYIEKVLPPIVSSPWATLTDLRGLTQAPISAYFEVSRIQRWSWRHNLSYQALVIDSARNLIHFREFAHIQHADRTRYFQGIEEAAAWLSSVGFPLCENQPTPDPIE